MGENLFLCCISIALLDEVKGYLMWLYHNIQIFLHNFLCKSIVINLIEMHWLFTQSFLRVLQNTKLQTYYRKAR